MEGEKWGDSVEGENSVVFTITQEEEEKNSKTKTQLTNDYIPINPLPEEHYYVHPLPQQFRESKTSKYNS